MMKNFIFSIVFFLCINVSADGVDNTYTINYLINKSEGIYLSEFVKKEEIDEKIVFHFNVIQNLKGSEKLKISFSTVSDIRLDFTNEYDYDEHQNLYFWEWYGARFDFKLRSKIGLSFVKGEKYLYFDGFGTQRNFEKIKSPDDWLFLYVKSKLNKIDFDVSLQDYFKSFYKITREIVSYCDDGFAHFEKNQTLYFNNKYKDESKVNFTIDKDMITSYLLKNRLSGAIPKERKFYCNNGDEYLVFHYKNLLVSKLDGEKKITNYQAVPIHVTNGEIQTQYLASELPVSLPRKISVEKIMKMVGSYKKPKKEKYWQQRATEE